LLTHPNFPPRNPKELIEYARANPNKVTWGSSGIGSSLHIGLAVMQGATGTQFTHIPYKGTAPLLTDLVGGQLQGTHTTTVSGEAMIKSKRVRRCCPTCRHLRKAASRMPSRWCGLAWLRR
jgi:tripartite-type tricarboxylate transporter receptor subunit TctC